MTDTEGSVDVEHMETEAMGALRTGLTYIAKEIQNFKTELKSQFVSFKEEIKKEMREELEDFKKGINQKLTETTKELASQATRIELAEQRVSEIEDWDMDVKEALTQALKQQRVLQNRDQEGRNRRNNICIFGLAEGAEGTSTTQFIKRLLTTELSLPAESDLQIQRAHRSLMPRPASDKPPRSIVVNFLQYTTKEMVLKEAWGKNNQIPGSGAVFRP